LEFTIFLPNCQSGTIGKQGFTDVSVTRLPARVVWALGRSILQRARWKTALYRALTGMMRKKKSQAG